MTQHRKPTSLAHRPILWGSLLVPILLAGCFGGTPVERSYFSLQYPADHGWRYETPRYPDMVRVKRCESNQAYDRQEMVYRANPHEFQYYWYKLWASKPRKMLHEMLANHLRASNIFQEVVLDIGDRLPQYDFICEVLAIEELNATQDEWYAHLSMRFALLRFDDGTRVWEHTFDARKPVYNRQPVYVVRTMSEIAEEQFNSAFETMDQFLAEATGAPAPAGGPLALVKQDNTETSEPTDGEDPNVPSARLKERK